MKLKDINFFDGLQRFGSAMFVVVALFPLMGLWLALIQIVKNPLLVGSFASFMPAQNIIAVMENGAWTLFNVMPMLFALGFPVMMATKAPARALVVAVLTYITYHAMINQILVNWGDAFGIDFTQEASDGNGLAMVANIKTLNVSILGGILIGTITTWIHNRFFDKPLPEAVSFFQGMSLVAFVAYLSCIPLAFATCLIWPHIQNGIFSLQVFMANSGYFGGFLYIFMEKFLLPTGLHHFIWIPFQLGDAVVTGGLLQDWYHRMNEIAQSEAPLKSLFPFGIFLMQGNTTMFGLPAVALAIYHTAKPENKKVVASMVIPAALTSMLTGITEPIEFTFLFVAPILFVVHALLSACMSTTMFIFGVSAPLGAGFLNTLPDFTIPMLSNHAGAVVMHGIIGIVFFFIYYFVFKFLIVKFNFQTPGRGEAELKLYSKAEFRDKHGISTARAFDDAPSNNQYALQAKAYLELLGGKENIDKATNCATRLRVTVKDDSKVAEDAQFTEAGAKGLVKVKNNYQVIIGPTVPNVKDEFDKLLLS